MQQQLAGFPDVRLVHRGEFRRRSQFAATAAAAVGVALLLSSVMIFSIEFFLVDIFSTVKLHSRVSTVGGVVDLAVGRGRLILFRNKEVGERAERYNNVAYR